MMSRVGLERKAFGVVDPSPRKRAAAAAAAAAAALGAIHIAVTCVTALHRVALRRASERAKERRNGCVIERTARLPRWPQPAGRPFVIAGFLLLSPSLYVGLNLGSRLLPTATLGGREPGARWMGCDDLALLNATSFSSTGQRLAGLGHWMHGRLSRPGSKQQQEEEEEEEK